MNRDTLSQSTVRSKSPTVASIGDPCAKSQQSQPPTPNAAAAENCVGPRYIDSRLKQFCCR
jgi:hypothetical protein